MTSDECLDIVAKKFNELKDFEAWCKWYLEHGTAQEQMCCLVLIEMARL